MPDPGEAPALVMTEELLDELDDVEVLALLDRMMVDPDCPRHPAYRGEPVDHDPGE